MSTSSLSATGSSSEPSADGLAAPPGEPAVEPVRRHRDARRRPSPSSRGSGSPRRRGRSRAGRPRPAPASADRRMLTGKENTRAMPPSTKILVANRGEIAVRIFRTLRELEHRARSPIYSEADRGALHAAFADEAYLVGPGTPAESYLNQERILDAAHALGRRGGPPGLRVPRRERRLRARGRGRRARLDRPAAEAIELMGSKVAARQTMSAAGVPIIPGTTEPVESADEVRRARRRVRLADRDQGLGRRRREGHEGRRLAPTRSSAPSSRPAARAQAYFSDDAVYVERYLEDPRHVEVQVLADAHGNGDPPRRARLHDPAPPPEARRGDAVAGRRRRAPRRDRRDRGRRRPRRRLPLGGHDRGAPLAATASTSSSR